MSDGSSEDKKKAAVKNIIRELHKGLSAEEAKRRLEKEVGSVSSAEIAEIEQALISEGVSPDEIKRFCNVHALIFETSLAESMAEEQSESHPAVLFKRENRETEAVIEKIRAVGEVSEMDDPKEALEKLSALLDSLGELERHYARKEQILFPYLERHDFFGPTQVMWGKDDEVRGLLKEARENRPEEAGGETVRSWYREYIVPLIEEAEGMIFKEENILYPTAREKLEENEWVAILKESSEIGYAFGVEPAETDALIQELKHAAAEEPEIREDGRIAFPSGDISPAELMHVLNALPVDITYIDADDRVRYFTENAHKVFARPRAVLGRTVQHCHPPQSVDKVEAILSAFKNGSRNSADFWLEMGGRFLYIRFFAVNDALGRYLGTMEVAQDVTDIRNLTGERRLIDEALEGGGPLSSGGQG
jgi:hypothetical protein